MLRDVYASATRFELIQADLGISREVLTQRLNMHVVHGTSQPHTDDAGQASLRCPGCHRQSPSAGDSCSLTGTIEGTQRVINGCCEIAENVDGRMPACPVRSSRTRSCSARLPMPAFVWHLGENITTRGMDLLGLPVGTRLGMGEAVNTVTGLRNPCQQIDHFRHDLLRQVMRTTTPSVWLMSWASEARITRP